MRMGEHRCGAHPHGRVQETLQRSGEEPGRRGSRPARSPAGEEPGRRGGPLTEHRSMATLDPLRSTPGPADPRTQRERMLAGDWYVSDEELGTAHRDAARVLREL